MVSTILSINVITIMGALGMAVPEETKIVTTLPTKANASIRVGAIGMVVSTTPA